MDLYIERGEVETDKQTDKDRGGESLYNYDNRGRNCNKYEISRTVKTREISLNCINLK